MSSERSKALRREQRKRYRKRYPDKIRAAKRLYKARKRGLLAAPPKRVVMTPEQRREKKNADFRAWYAKNRDRARAIAAKSYEKWFLKNGGKHRIKRSPEEEREFRKEANRIAKHARKARKKANGGRMSRGLKSRLFEVQKGCCAYCHAPLTVSHLDHIMPLALGGSGDDQNYQLLCPDCNIKKGALHPVEYAQRIGLLL